MMKKVFFLIAVLVFSLNISVFAGVESQYKDNNAIFAVQKCSVIKNKLFAIDMPAELKKTYEIKKEKDRISVIHKASKKAGFGGFAFGIKAYKNPADHATLPGGKKIGELTDKKGVLYDMVLKYPTDVQYDYTKSPEAPKEYAVLYDLGEDINIHGVKGSVYYKNQGTKGADLYSDILKKHITAIKEKWDSSKLENENMSYMYNVIGQSDKKVLNKIGYIYYDLNADGIDELLIGEIASGAWKGVVYDIYTMVDRKPKHVVSGGSRDRYFACDGTFVCNEYSGGAGLSGVNVYSLEENSTELFPQVSFKYDSYTNPEKPYYLSYGSDSNQDKWKNVDEETYKERKKVFERYERFDFIPLSKFSEKKKADSMPMEDKFIPKKDYFDYSALIKEFPKDYFYTTVKIKKSNERILIVTDKISADKTSCHGLFYYLTQNGFVFPLGYLKSTKPISQSDNYLYLTEKDTNIKVCVSDKRGIIQKTKADKITENIKNIKFETIQSAEKFSGDYGEPAGDDVVKADVDGFCFYYHKTQYKKKYIEKLMKECIKDGVKTNVQMYCQMVKKLHS
ncbi:MAG: hypothetical protein K6C94_03940 [Candidatus Gastranaerophilales bacterium]|nr:hypothetical protein [Candidatus Gastranaerophilales bacterium]